MKFSNGCWLNKQGIVSSSPQEVCEVTRKGNTVQIITPTQHIKKRGDILSGPVLTYEISAPLKNIMKVRIEHYKGESQNGPEYALHTEDLPVEVIHHKGKVEIKNGELSLEMSDEGQFKLTFKRAGKYLTSSAFEGTAYIKNYNIECLDEAVESAYMREQLGLLVDELIYGLGEQVTPLVKNGQSIETCNEDGVAFTKQSYKNIPFYVSNRGYGIFVNHPEKVSFDVGSKRASKVQFSVMGESLEYFIISGESVKEVLRGYTQLTGKPALPPAWSFGLWLTNSFTTNYDEETVMGFVEKMSEVDIPLRVFHLDYFWVKGFKWRDFTWNREAFKEPEHMLKQLKEKGLKICVWINPYIAQGSSLFEEAMQEGYLIKRKNGSIWQCDMWQSGMGMVDFTNPRACQWFKDKLGILLDMGIDCFKTDFGERIPTSNVVYYDGSNPMKMHNYYTYLYNQEVFNLLKEKKGEKEAVLFAHSATIGGQSFPVHWGGNSEAHYESMAESLRGGLSLCLSGFGFFSHDVGGFESTQTADVYKRWVAFGLLSSHSRLHGSTSYKVPWLYDEEVVQVIQYFSKLKCKLMPYLFKTASDTAQTGIPTMRAMMLEFEEDQNCAYLDKQYMLGESILVAPIFNSDGMAKYYVPEGVWTNFLTGERIEGGRWIKEKHTYLSMPILIRPNSLIALGNCEVVPDYDYADKVTLAAYELQEDEIVKTEVINQNEEVELYVAILKQDDLITMQYKGVGKPWTFVMKGIYKVQEVQGGEMTIEEDGIHIQVEGNEGAVICNL